VRKNRRNILPALVVGVLVVTVCIFNNCTQSTYKYNGRSNAGIWNNPLVLPAGTTAATQVLPLPIIGNESNVVPISIGYPNQPYISLTVCLPGTTQCQTIDKVKLDTGSTGLRIFASALTLTFPYIYNGSGVLTECYAYGGGSSDWGPVATADVRLGGETASSVNVQLINAYYPTIPSDCSSGAGYTPETGPAMTGYNAILGISPFQNDCFDAQYCNNVPGQIPAYYSCKGSYSCIRVTAPPSMILSNPIAKLSGDNNGYAIQIPSIPDIGATTISGAYLVLGIGTQSNNTPPAGVTTLMSDGYDHILTAFQGESVPTSFIDSGTWDIEFSVPSMPNVTTCTLSNGLTGYCPTAPLSLSAFLNSADATVQKGVSFRLYNGLALQSSNNVMWSDLVSPNSTPNYGGGSSYFVWGLPFFFGKTIYFGMNGSSSPIGSGMYYGL
jgi:hypothetical protein